MAEEEEGTQSQEAVTPGMGGLIVKGLIVVVLALVTSVAGGTVTWVMISRSGILPEIAGDPEAVDDEVDAVTELLENGAVVNLEPFIVNLADIDTPRYLRVQIDLIVDDKTTVDELIENATVTSKTRDVILQTLARKKSSDLKDEEGKEQLRAEILERLAPFYHTPKVVDVLFTEFIIQL